VFEALALRRARVIEQHGGGGERNGHTLDAEAREVARREVRGQQPLASFRIELPIGEPAQHRRQRLDERQRKSVRHQHLGRAKPLELRLERFRRTFQDAEVAVREVQPRQPEHPAVQVRREQQRIRAIVEQRRVGQRAGRHDAAHRALHRPLRRRWVADLLRDHNGFAELHEPCEVLLHRMERHTRHPDRPAGRLPARRQRDVEQPRRLLRIVEEQLVEVAHPVEEEGIGVLRLDAQVLLHHRGVARLIGAANRLILVYCIDSHRTLLL